MTIQYATFPDVEQLRRSLQDAPAHWRREVDKARARRGLPLLWHKRAAVAATPAARPKPAAPKPAKSRNTLVGLVCPGTSNPVRLGADDELLPEVILPRAFDKYLARVAAGERNVDLQIGHAGSLVVASTRDGTLKLGVDHCSGLWFEASLDDAAYERLLFWKIASARAGTVGLSAALAHVTAHTEERSGRRVRVVTECGLGGHIAVMMPGAPETPAYSRSCVAAVPRDADADAVRYKLLLSVAGR